LLSYCSTTSPPHCHIIPSGSTRRVARDLRHLLAINSVSQKFLGCLHRATLPHCTRSPDNNILILSNVKLVPILFLDTGEIVALDYVADQMANGNGDGQGYLPAQQAEPGGITGPKSCATIELAQGLKGRTACLRLGSCRSWLFLLGIYKDAVRCPAAFTDEHQKTRITSDRSNLRDTGHKTSAALTPWKQRDVHWT